MSEQELYEIARERIDKRNRLMTWWGIHLAAFLAYIGVFIAIVTTEFNSIALLVLLAWCGAFVAHTMWWATASSRENDIDEEVKKLRQKVDEKPKRLALGDDGELVETHQDEYEQRLGIRKE